MVYKGLMSGEQQYCKTKIFKTIKLQQNASLQDDLSYK